MKYTYKEAVLSININYIFVLKTNDVIMWQTDFVFFKVNQEADNLFWVNIKDKSNDLHRLNC